MTPLVIDEERVFVFKFWFNGEIRQGMYYREELFCCLGSFEGSRRAAVYQLGCKLMLHGARIILSCSAEQCRLWGDLRAPLVKDILLNSAALNLDGVSLPFRSTAENPVIDPEE